MTLLTDALLLPHPSVDPEEAWNDFQSGRGPDADIGNLASELGIQEMLHFTTFSGLVGILGSGALHCRDSLPREKLLEYVYKPNNKTRRDSQWNRWINLSLTDTNRIMFQYSEREHAAEGAWWVMLSFDPAPLADAGVVFTTTNNIYPAAIRSLGIAGLASMYRDPVAGRYSHLMSRASRAANQPTDPQAEVLYPLALGIQHLTKIYVEKPEQCDKVSGLLYLPLPREPEIICAPERFR